MGFREVCEIFGGSIFVEEPRGSFVEAYKRIEQLKETLTVKDTKKHAALLLLKGIHAALISNLHNDERCCQKCLQLLCKAILARDGSLGLGSISCLFLPGNSIQRCSASIHSKEALLEAVTDAHVHDPSLADQCLAGISTLDPLDELEFFIICEVWTLSHRGLEAARAVLVTYILR